MTDPIEILITIAFSDDQLEQLRGISTNLKLRVVKATKAEEIPSDIWATTEVLYTSRVLPSLEAAPKLRWIQFHWAGVDHAVSAPILRKPGLTATSMSGASASQVAEYIVMMLLALGHKMPDMVNAQKRSEWPKDRWERFSPRELRDSTVGIVGYGSIGRQVARLLHPFGVTVLATKQDVMHPSDEGYTPDGLGDLNGDYIQRIYPPEALRSMIKVCDFVVITVPLTQKTRNMINLEILDGLQPTAYLVDASRGGIIDHAALINALKDHKLAGAALDVFPEEPLSSESPLWKMPNVIISPHISGNTPYYDDRALALFRQNLERYLAGQPLLNPIDPMRGY
jgi:phosphoglycerate dehydrogenase-like enzyme